MTVGKSPAPLNCAPLRSGRELLSVNRWTSGADWDRAVHATRDAHNNSIYQYL